MKQITKIIFICSLLCLPVQTLAQEGLNLPENVANQPIVDSGFAQPENEQELNEVLKSTEEEKKLVSPVSTIEPKPLIHVEQLGWDTFKFRSSYRLGLDSYKVKWEFGDGQSSSERIVHHSYTKPGVYQVRLEIIADDGEMHTVSNTVQVGFFNLANWRLWILILLLAGIIVIASIIAGATEEPITETAKKKKGLLADLDDESVLNTLNDEFGDLDSLGQIGMGTHELAEELAFLEEMDIPKKKKTKPKKAKKSGKARSGSTKKATKEKKKKTVRKKKTSKTKSTKKQSKTATKKTKPKKKSTSKKKTSTKKRKTKTKKS